MRLYSEHGTAKFILSLLGFLWVLALVLVVTNASLSCIDQNGCLRSFCKLEWLKREYRLLVNQQGNLCQYQNSSLANNSRLNQN